MTKFVLSSETRFYLENVVSVKDTSHIVLVIFQCTHHLQNKRLFTADICYTIIIYIKANTYQKKMYGSLPLGVSKDPMIK